MIERKREAMIGGNPHVTQIRHSDWPAADICWRGYLPSIIVIKYNVDSYLFAREVVFNPHIKYCEIPEKRKEILSVLLLTSNVVDSVHQNTRKRSMGI